MDDTLHLSPWPNAINDWTFAQVHLPEAFHSDQGFQYTITSLKTPPMNVRQQVGMVLGMGLMIRDIMGALQIEPGKYPPVVPAWVITSPLNTVEFVNVLLENAPVLERLNTR